MALEINAYLSYSNLDYPLNYWRTDSGIEVDFIVDNRIGIEVKASVNTSNRDNKNLKKLKDEGNFESLIVLNLASKSTVVEGVQHLNILDFVKLLWSSKLF